MQEIAPPGQGHLLSARGNVLAFKAVAAQTGGDFSLMERTVPAGARMPPPHRHVNCSEAFFVLAGEITFRLGDAAPNWAAAPPAPEAERELMSRYGMEPA